MTVDSELFDILMDFIRFHPNATLADALAYFEHYTPPSETDLVAPALSRDSTQGYIRIDESKMILPSRRASSVPPGTPRV